MKKDSRICKVGKSVVHFVTLHPPPPPLARWLFELGFAPWILFVKCYDVFDCASEGIFLLLFIWLVEGSVSLEDVLPWPSPGLEPARFEADATVAITAAESFPLN